MSDSREKLGLCIISEHMKCSEDSVTAAEDLLGKGPEMDLLNPYDDNKPQNIAIGKQNIDWISFLMNAGANPAVVGISAEDPVVEKNVPEMAIALQQFKKINEKYLVTVNYTQAMTKEILEITDAVKVLKVNSCASTRNVELLLLKKSFINLIQNSEVFILLFELDKVKLDPNILDLMSTYFEKPIFIQFYSENSSFLYFNDLVGNIKNHNIDQNELESANENELETSEIQKINFELVYNLLNSSDGCYGKININFSKIEIDMNRQFNDLTLANLALTKNDLLRLKFSKSPEMKLSFCINTHFVTKAIEHGNLEDLKLTIGFSNFNCFKDGKYLILAVQSGRFEIVKYLLENNCNKNVVDDLGNSATDRALKANHFVILLELLQNDCPFPVDYKKVIANQSVPEVFSLGLQKLITFKDEFHKNIQANKIEKIKDFIGKNMNVKNAYTLDNQCALTTALKEKRFEIYSFLRSEGFSEGIDDEYLKTLKNLDIYEREKIKIYNRKYFKCSDSNYLQELISHSHLGFGSSQKNFSKIKKYFLMLNSIPEVQPILKVVGNASKLNIIFDFLLDSVCDIDPTQMSDHTIVRGRTNYKVGNISIGAKQAENHVLATLAHEMTHLAIHILYENLGKPYREDDYDLKEKFEKVAETTCRVRDENEIIANAFEYRSEDMHSELIVRVPQMCALYRNEPNELSNLKNVFIELFQYFDDIIVKDCIAKIPIMKAENKVQNLNQLLSLYSKYESFRWFSAKHELYADEIFNENSSLIVQTNHPELFIASVIKSQKDLLSKSYMFFNADHLSDETYFDIIKDTFNSLKHPKLFVVQSMNPKSYDIDPILMTLKKDSKIIFISTALPVSANTFGDIIDLQYNWDDLCDESKQQFMCEKVDFQGKKMALNDLVSKSDIFTQLPLQDVFNLKNWTVNNNWTRKDFYIDRVFTRKGPSHFLTADDVCDQILEQKVIILTGEAGEGKSRTAIDLAGKLIERTTAQWIIYIESTMLQQSFLTNEDPQFEQINREVLTNVLCLSKLQTMLFNHLFDLGRIIFFVDGYDINSVHSQFDLKLFKMIKESQNLLLVTSRYNLSELEVEAIYIQPFTKIDQRSFLIKYWSQQCSENEDALAADADALIQKFEKSTIDFLGNPKRIKMLADICGDQSENQPQKKDADLILIFLQIRQMEIDRMFVGKSLQIQNDSPYSNIKSFVSLPDAEKIFSRNNVLGLYQGILTLLMIRTNIWFERMHPIISEMQMNASILLTSLTTVKNKSLMRKFRDRDILSNDFFAYALKIVLNEIFTVVFPPEFIIIETAKLVEPVIPVIRPVIVEPLSVSLGIVIGVVLSIVGGLMNSYMKS